MKLDKKGLERRVNEEQSRYDKWIVPIMSGFTAAVIAIAAWYGGNVRGKQDGYDAGVLDTKAYVQQLKEGWLEAGRRQAFNELFQQSLGSCDCSLVYQEGIRFGREYVLQFFRPIGMEKVVYGTLINKSFDGEDLVLKLKVIDSGPESVEERGQEIEIKYSARAYNNKELDNYLMRGKNYVAVINKYNLSLVPPVQIDDFYDVPRIRPSPEPFRSF